MHIVKYSETPLKGHLCYKGHCGGPIYIHTHTKMTIELRTPLYKDKISFPNGLKLNL